MKKVTVIAALVVTLFGASAWIGSSFAGDSDAASKTAQAETAKVELAVENMTCATCPIAVRKALEKVEGTLDVDVDFGTKLATVTYDPKLTNIETLAKATTDAGFPSSPAN